MLEKVPKLLIVDDEPKNVKLLKAMIAPMGVETYTATGGLMALELVERISFDVILLDIMMPDLNGIEVCKRLKEDKKTRNIPVVFVTAFADLDNHASAIEAGGIGFITKPVQDVLMEATVRNAVRMKALSDEVEELQRHRQNLTNMIVHDINNLLTTVITGSDLLLMEDDLSPEKKEEISDIQKAGMGIRTMTQSLLDVEKMEAGKLELSIEEIDGWQVAEERVKLFAAQARERQINFKLEKPQTKAMVKADSFLLSRVFDNLLSNAIKFCPEKGSVKIEAYRNDGKWMFAVVNDGASIPQEYHDRIFHKFSQLEVREATGRKGVGLGLAFCKMAIEAMAGSITVESPIKGRKDGVRFVFHVPSA